MSDDEFEKYIKFGPHDEGDAKQFKVILSMLRTFDRLKLMEVKASISNIMEHGGCICISIDGNHIFESTYAWMNKFRNMCVNGGRSDR